MKKLIANWGNYPVIEANEESFAFPEQLTESAYPNLKGSFPGVMDVVMVMLPWRKIPFPH